MKEVLIKITDELYDALDSPGDEELYRYMIRQGKVLPKGHGDLKDVSALDAGPVYDDQGQQVGYKYVTKYELDNAPIIIEADKENHENY